MLAAGVGAVEGAVEMEVIALMGEVVVEVIVHTRVVAGMQEEQVAGQAEVVATLSVYASPQQARSGMDLASRLYYLSSGYRRLTRPRTTISSSLVRRCCLSIAYCA